jgi:ribonuclease-3
LGDAVLELCVSEYLYTSYKRMREGDMTRARAMSVCEDSLCEASSKLGLGAFLRLSHGEQITGGREKPSILADVFEAVTGAIYLDGGLEPARRFILDQLEQTIKKAALGIGVEDYKTQLQELVQLQGRGPVKYDIIAMSGPDHMREFVAQVSCGGEVLGRGSGRSKKDAQQQAARQALNK